MAQNTCTEKASVRAVRSQPTAELGTKSIPAGLNQRIFISRFKSQTVANVASQASTGHEEVVNIS